MLVVRACISKEDGADPEGLCQDHRLSCGQQLVVNLHVLDGQTACLPCARHFELPVHVLQHDQGQLQNQCAQFLCLTQLERAVMSVCGQIQSKAHHLIFKSI